MATVIQSINPTSPFQTDQSLPSTGIFPPGQEPVIGGLASVARLKTYNEQLVNVITDDSGSMSGSKGSEASAAGNALLAELADPKNKDGFRVNLIRFGSNSTLEASAAPPESINVSVTGSSGGTTAAPALTMALDGERNFRPRAERRRVPGVVVFMSDGQLSDKVQAVHVAEELKRAGVTVITIGFGAGADTATLQRIASSPNHYAFAAVGSLVGVFAKVGKTISQQLGKTQ